MTQQKTLDVVALGNALMDILCPVDDATLTKLGLAKDSMALIDESRASELMHIAHAQGKQTPGGSACNTLAGLASAGARTGFMGKLARDEVGAAYAQALEDAGIAFSASDSVADGMSGRSIIFVTQDGARTMNTLLGVSADFDEKDVDADLIATAKILYLEGYLFDKPSAKAAFAKAAEYAQENSTKIALTLSDAFCVDRHRDEFLHFIQERCDIVFCNAAEVLALYETTDFDGASLDLADQCEIAAITKGPEGAALYVDGAKIVDQSAYKTDVIDTTGAGDQFAAGVLFGLCNGHHLAYCAEFGAKAASEVISHFGARPETPYSELFASVKT